MAGDERGETEGREYQHVHLLACRAAASLKAGSHYVSVSHGWWFLKHYPSFGLISHLIGI